MKQKKNTAVSRKERKVRRLMFCAAGAAAMVIIVYVFGAYPFYTKSKISTIKEVYEGISEMTLAALEEEDEEQLRSYSGENLNIVIANSSFDTVYSSRSKGTKEQIRGYIESHIEDYQEVPVVDVQKNEEMRIIRMRGRLQQEQPYYVYIRKELRGAGEMIFYTTLYMIICAAAGLGVLYALMKREQRPAASCAKGYEAQEGAEPQARADGAGAHIDQQFPSLSTADAAHMERVQKEFVANVSHELKTPLAVIASQIEMLQNMGDGIDRAYYFSSIREEVEKMSEMVGTLLDMTTIENKLEQMEVSEINFSQVIAYMTMKYDALFHKRGIHLAETVEEGCFVRGNRMYLEQAVNNYIMNAFQYAPSGGTVRIALEKEKGYAALSIYNDGRQINEADMDKIWENFYQSSPENRKNGRRSNVGLGLYMVRKIIEQHQGQCGAENKDVGVEFWIKIPLVKS